MTEPRWTQRGDVPRGASYDARFERLAASGQHVHGEDDLVEQLAPGRRVLDAGCGTGRVAIELHQRGFEVVGVDVDAHMLDAARSKAPELPWEHADLATLALDHPPYDLAVLAGNVLIFVAPHTEHQVVQRIAQHLRPGGMMVAGFTLEPAGYGTDHLDRHAAEAGMHLIDRWSTWERGPWSPDATYQVSVHAKR